MKTLTDYLKNNPAKRNVYIKASYVALNVGAIGATKLMRHLLEVQNIDLNTQPGERQRSAIAKLFEGFHTSGYDSDFDFSKFWEKIKGSVSHLNLTKERFKELTDISKLSDEVQNLQVTATAAPAVPQDELEAMLGYEEFDSTEQDLSLGRKLAELDKDSIQAALKVLKKYADQNTPKKSRKEELMEKAEQAFKTGAFSRIPKNED